MEPLQAEDGSTPNSPLPEAGHDSEDPLRPEIEEEDAAGTPPLADPRQDTELNEDNGDISDDESDLSEIDEARFEGFDPTAIAIDESNVGLIGVHKRKRGEGEDAQPKKKRREKKREKPSKTRAAKDSDGNFSGGEEIEGKRIRKRKDPSEKKDRPRARVQLVENEEDLTPEERRKRALDRKMDEAVRNPNARRRRADGIDLEAQNDELIEHMRRRMAEAAQNDTEARQRGQPAMQKLKMLPEVVALLNRNTLRDQLVDPETNLLEAVRFFLEPLNDGSLPAYNIQRELFAALGKLPIDKSALVASGIGKVTLFYTKSQKPELSIKRQAEKLLGVWTRPILKRSDDFRKKEYTEAAYDPNAVPIRPVMPGGSSQAAAASAAARERLLAMPNQSNRARIEGGASSYTIVPRNTVTSQSQYSRPMGASGDLAFRRIKARQQGKR